QAGADVCYGALAAVSAAPAHFRDFFFSSRRRHTRSKRDWSSDVCSSDLGRTNGDTLKAFEMNIFHYEPFSTVYGGAAKQQRRYEQLFHRHRYYAFFLTNSHNREKSLKSASPINSTSRIEPMR